MPVRRLRRSPLLSAAVILIVAGSIAANAAAFALFNGVLLRRQPFLDGDRLVAIERMTGVLDGRVSLVELLDWRARTRAFEDIAGYRTESSDLVTSDGAVPLVGAVVTPTFFGVARSEPLLGMLPVSEAWEVDGLPSVVLTEGLWRMQFGAERTVLGRIIRLNTFNNSQTYRIAGVARNAASVHLSLPYHFYIPERMDRNRAPTTRRNLSFYAIGKLNAGVESHQAADDLTRVVFDLIREFPASPEAKGASVSALDEAQFAGAKAPLLLLSLAGLSLLLIACINIATLLLASGMSRAHELSVRVALGAARHRLVKELMAEYLTLALAGGVMGCGLAFFATKALVVLAPSDLPRLDEVSFGWLVVAFTIALTSLAALLFGPLPAILLTRMQMSPLLKAGGEHVVGRHTVGWAWQECLVAAQFAAVLALLVGAGLLVNSLVRLSRVDLGFQTDDLTALQMTVGPRIWQSPERYVAFQSELLHYSRNTPGVAAAALSFSIPPTAEGRFSVGLRSGQRIGAVSRVVSSGYFDVLGVPLVTGRDFPSPPDYRDFRKVIVNEAFAQRYLAPSPIGQLLQVGPEWCDVIGVVGNVRERSIREQPEPTVYAIFSPLGLAPRAFSLTVRTADSTVASRLRAFIASLDAEVPVTVVSVRQRIAGHYAENRFYAMTLAAFAGFGLLLASVAVFAMMAERVNERRREYAVRIVCGASARAIVWMVWRRIIPLFALGCGVGASVTMGLVGWLRHLLFDVTPGDFTTAGIVLGLLMLATAAAAYLPTRRALAVDPAVTLRAE